MRRNLIIKQTLFAIALVLSCGLASAQSLRFKTSYDSPKSSSSLKFETASFAGKLSANNQELVLKIKNTGQKHYTNQSLKITLTDITNLSAKLCHSGNFKLAAGDRISLSLHNCDKHYGEYYCTEKELEFGWFHSRMDLFLKVIDYQLKNNVSYETLLMKSKTPNPKEWASFRNFA